MRPRGQGGSGGDELRSRPKLVLYLGLEELQAEAPVASVVRPAARRASVTLARCIVWGRASTRKLCPYVANSCSSPLGGAFVGLSRSASLRDSRSFRFRSRNCRYFSRTSAKGG